METIVKLEPFAGTQVLIKSNSEESIAYVAEMLSPVLEEKFNARTIELSLYPILVTLAVLVEEDPAEYKKVVEKLIEDLKEIVRP